YPTARPDTYPCSLHDALPISLLNFYKIPLENLIVIHDELDINFDTLRIKRGGGEGGHNGLKSISQTIGTKDYLRVRVGIGRPPRSEEHTSELQSRFDPVCRRL